jgi:hypothetical protein
MAESPRFSLRFSPSAIGYWSSRYNYSLEAHVIDHVAPAVRQRGSYTWAEFLDVCRWKTARTQKLCATNTDDFVRDVTDVALSTPNERLRIEVLTLLSGVDWPTASVLLHFGHRDPYPILDYRALWSLGVDASSVRYTFHLWIAYTETCREIAVKAGVSLRELDRALWQFSKEMSSSPATQKTPSTI